VPSTVHTRKLRNVRRAARRLSSDPFSVLGFGGQRSDYSEPFSPPAMDFPALLPKGQSSGRQRLSCNLRVALTHLALAPIFFLVPKRMSSTAFGEHLKREREMRGVSLEEIAAATRINTRFLEAIENERWDQLPGGVFNRGFIRSVARYLGMDEDALVAEYDLDAKSNGSPGASARPASSAPIQQMPRNWRPAVVAIVILALLIAAGIFSYLHYRKKIPSGFHRGAAALVAKIHSIEAKRHAALATTDSHAANVSAHPNLAPPASTVAANTAAPLTLKLEAGKPANVKVIADGKVLFDGPVQVNDVKQFQAGNQFQITSSESSALLLELNGQTVPPIGTPGQPGSVTLTRSDLNSATGDPH